MKVREHDFVGKQRCPLESGSAGGIGATDELMLAVGKFYEHGVTKLVDDLLASALRNQIFKFHTPQL